MQLVLALAEVGDAGCGVEDTWFRKRFLERVQRCNRAGLEQARRSKSLGCVPIGNFSKSGPRQSNENPPFSLAGILALLRTPAQT